MNTLPIIDIRPLYLNDRTALKDVADQIDKACRTWGFFYIKGHPISQARIDALLDAGRRFFSQPLEEKLKIDITQSTSHRGYGAIATEQLDPEQPGDYKETFDMSYHLPPSHPDVAAGKPLRGPNRHPELPGWEALWEQHYQDMHALGLTLLRAIAIALGAPEDFFTQRFNEPISALRIIRYPARQGAASLSKGAGEHTDYGCVTLLYQDPVGGLQVRNLEGEWIDAPFVPGTFVVNIGDMMARWSNDRYKSTPHRVISSLQHERYSIPYFVEPNPETVIDCLPGCFDAEHPPRYETTRCVDYMLRRFSETYSYRKTEASETSEAT
ncbi:MAG: 2-oxoglutarate and iron-dependent oxygenase domain-containing protein [Comamonas sp.]